MKAIPQVSAVAADPESIDQLDGRVAAAVGAAFTALAVRCALRAAAAPVPQKLPSITQWVTLSPEEAAHRLGIRPATLLQESRAGRRYAGLRVATGSRRAMFSLARLEAFLAPSPFRKR